MSQNKTLVFCGFSRTNPLIPYKFGCSRAKTQRYSHFYKKGYFRKNGEFAKFSLTTHSHILLNNCGYTAYICNLKSSADSPLQIHQFAFHLQSILQLINPEWDIQNFRSVRLFRDIKGPYIFITFDWNPRTSMVPCLWVCPLIILITSSACVVLFQTFE